MTSAARLQAEIRDQFGNLIEQARVYVCTYGTTVAGFNASTSPIADQAYSDAACTQTLAQPLVADGNGTVVAYFKTPTANAPGWVTLYVDDNTGTAAYVGAGGAAGSSPSFPAYVRDAHTELFDAAGRWVGSTGAYGAPASGTWDAGDFGVDLAGNVVVCTAAGTPGTWKILSPSIGGGTVWIDAVNGLDPGDTGYVAALAGKPAQPFRTIDQAFSNNNVGIGITFAIVPGSTVSNYPISSPPQTFTESAPISVRAGCKLVGPEPWGTPGYLTTTVAAGSNGQAVNALTSGVLNVAATTGAPSSGQIVVETETGNAIVNYTGLTSTTFTGCTSESSGVVLTGYNVGILQSPTVGCVIQAGASFPRNQPLVYVGDNAELIGCLVHNATAGGVGFHAGEITAVAVTGAGPYTVQVTVASTGPANPFTVGELVTMAGSSNSAMNASVTVTAIGGSSGAWWFQYSAAASPGAIGSPYPGSAGTPLSGAGVAVVGGSYTLARHTWAWGCAGHGFVVASNGDGALWDTCFAEANGLDENTGDGVGIGGPGGGGFAWWGGGANGNLGKTRSVECRSVLNPLGYAFMVAGYPLYMGGPQNTGPVRIEAPRFDAFGKGGIALLGAQNCKVEGDIYYESTPSVPAGGPVFTLDQAPDNDGTEKFWSVDCSFDGPAYLHGSRQSAYFPTGSGVWLYANHSRACTWRSGGASGANLSSSYPAVYLDTQAWQHDVDIRDVYGGDPSTRYTTTNTLVNDASAGANGHLISVRGTSHRTISYGGSTIQGVKEVIAAPAPGTITPSATASTFGSNVTISPPTGSYGLVPITAVWNWSGGNGTETFTIRLTAVWSDLSTSSVSHAVTNASSGSVGMTQAELYSLVSGKDGLAITSLVLAAESSIASSAATGTFDLVGRYT